jgi:hypothetical protein
MKDVNAFWLKLFNEFLEFVTTNHGTSLSMDCKYGPYFAHAYKYICSCMRWRYLIPLSIVKQSKQLIFVHFVNYQMM